MKDPVFVYPQDVERPEDGDVAQQLVRRGGLQLREYFAAHAMAGLASGRGLAGLPWGEIATTAYKLADGMMAEYEKREGA